MRKIVLIGAALTFGAAAAYGAETPKIVSEPVARTSTTITGEKITVPQNPQVVVNIATFAPGAALPVHRHPYPHYVYVLDGALTVTNVETGKTFVANKGAFFAETNTAWHFGKNEGATPVKILVIDQLPQGVTSNMQLQGGK